jgi:hypothetical protein
LGPATASPGLPDGLVSNQNPKFGYILYGLEMASVGIFLDLWSVLRPFGIFNGHLVYFGFVWYIFSRFGMLYQEKSGKPWTRLGVEENSSFSCFRNVSGFKCCLGLKMTVSIIRSNRFV